MMMAMVIVMIWNGKYDGDGGGGGNYKILIMGNMMMIGWISAYLGYGYVCGGIAGIEVGVGVVLIN